MGVDQHPTESQCQISAFFIPDLLFKVRIWLPLLEVLYFYQRQEGGEIITPATPATLIRKTHMAPEIPQDITFKSHYP